MRIGGTYTQSTAATHTTTKSAHAHKGHHAAKSGEAPSSGAVKVTLSDKARELDETQAPEASEKVQNLRSAIESGQFTADPSKIAAAIVGE